MLARYLCFVKSPAQRKTTHTPERAFLYYERASDSENDPHASCAKATWICAGISIRTPTCHVEVGDGTPLRRPQELAARHCLVPEDTPHRASEEAYGGSNQTFSRSRQQEQLRIRAESYAESTIHVTGCLALSISTTNWITPMLQQMVQSWASCLHASHVGWRRGDSHAQGGLDDLVLANARLALNSRNLSGE